MAGKGQRRTKAGRLVCTITREEVESYFHMPSGEACKHLGVGLTILKRICRRFGIPRWPYNRAWRSYCSAADGATQEEQHFEDWAHDNDSPGSSTHTGGQQQGDSGNGSTALPALGPRGMQLGGLPPPQLQEQELQQGAALMASVACQEQLSQMLQSLAAATQRQEALPGGIDGSQLLALVASLSGSGGTAPVAAKGAAAPPTAPAFGGRAFAPVHASLPASSAAPAAGPGGSEPLLDGCVQAWASGAVGQGRQQQELTAAAKQEDSADAPAAARAGAAAARAEVAEQGHREESTPRALTPPSTGALPSACIPQPNSPLDMLALAANGSDETAAVLREPRDPAVEAVPDGPCSSFGVPAAADDTPVPTASSDASLVATLQLLGVAALQLRAHLAGDAQQQALAAAAAQLAAACQAQAARAGSGAAAAPASSLPRQAQVPAEVPTAQQAFAPAGPNIGQTGFVDLLQSQTMAEQRQMQMQSSSQLAAMLGDAAARTGGPRGDTQALALLQQLAATSQPAPPVPVPLSPFSFAPLVQQQPMPAAGLLGLLQQLAAASASAPAPALPQHQQRPMGSAFSAFGGNGGALGLPRPAAINVATGLRSPTN